MREHIAALIGLIVAPIFPGLMFGAMTPLTPKGSDLQTVIALFPTGYFFATLVTVVVGVPFFLIGKHLELIRWWSTVIIGFAIGASVSISIQWPDFRGLPSAPSHVLVLGLTGAVGAFTFWLIWEQGQKSKFSGRGE